MRYATLIDWRASYSCYMVNFMTDTQIWTPNDKPNLGDILKWNEPLWAEPNKPRGKRDKIGEQEIIAELITITDFLEFKVVAVKKISGGDAPLKVQSGDMIKRKKSSIEKGNCQKLLSNG